MKLSKLLNDVIHEKINVKAKIYIELEENIEAVTEQTPFGNIYEITGYRIDDDGDIYLNIK